GHGILGADVAAAAAVAAGRAGGLPDTRRIDRFLPADRQRRYDRLLAQSLSRGLQRLELGPLGGTRIAHRPHPALSAALAFPEQAVLGDLAGPYDIGEHARIGPERHAGIDKRAAADTAADQHVHVIAETHVVEAGGRSGTDALAGELHPMPQIRKAR